MATTELTERDITKKMLEDAAADMSAVMKFEEAIPTGKKIVKAAIQADVIEAAGELRAEDVLKPKTVEVLTALGVMLPVEDPITEPATEEEGKEEEKSKDEPAESVPEPAEAESVTENLKETKPKNMHETKTEKIGRMAAIVQAMVNGTELFDDTMAEISNGLASVSNIKEQTFWLRGIRQFVNALNENGFEIIETP